MFLLGSLHPGVRTGAPVRRVGIRGSNPAGHTTAGHAGGGGVVL